MAERYRYDRHGKYLGKTSDKAPDIKSAAMLVGGVVLLFFLIWAGGLCGEWRHLSFPYKWVAFFYNYVVFEPIKAVLYICKSMSSVTPYPNLNTVLMFLIPILYIAVVALIVYLLVKRLRRGPKRPGIIIVSVLLAPAFIGGVWWAVSWLFAS